MTKPFDTTHSNCAQSMAVDPADAEDCPTKEYQRSFDASIEPGQLSEPPPEQLDRYAFHRLLASGGMASVYLGSCNGAADFSKVVAIKRLHAQFALDPEFASRFRDEAWLCARLLHPNVVQILDVVSREGELLLIMEYVEGVTLRTLLSDFQAVHRNVPGALVLGIMVPALHGLHAAHEAEDDIGQPLQIVHRDFSPQNIMVTREGHTKVLDFGIAKARGQFHSTATGMVPGKFGYLSPEQIRGVEVDRRADIFAAGVVLWESLTGARLFHERGLAEGGVLDRVLNKIIPPPSTINPEIPTCLDAIVLRALERDPAARFQSARDLAIALEAAAAPATPTRIAEYLQQVSRQRLVRLSELRTSARSQCLSIVPVSIPVPLTATFDSQSTSVDEDHLTSSSGVIPRRRYRRSGRNTAIASVAVAASLLLASLGIWRRDTLQAKQISGRQHAAQMAVPAAEPAAPTRALTTLSTKLVVGAAPPMPDPPGVLTLPSRPQLADRAQPVPSARPSMSARKALPTVTHWSPPKTVAPKKRSGLSAEASKHPAVSDSNCNPPTYIDAEGIRHFKDGCL